MGICPDSLYSALSVDLRKIDPSGSTAFWPGMSVNEAAVVNLRKSFFKKLLTKESPHANSRALSLFKAANDRCRDWTLSLDSSLDEILWNEFRDSVYRFFTPGGLLFPTEYSDYMSEGSVGGGNSLGVKGTSLYEKMYASPLTFTSNRLYDEYRRYTSSVPRLNDAELLRSEELGVGSVVKGSRIDFVPKTDDISRTICVEPSLNMYAQLGFAKILNRRIREVFNIHLSDQPDKNREMAFIGSVNDGPQSFATIDLSSASDSISLNMLRLILPRNVMNVLLHLRSPYVLIDKEQYELNMVSSMGNGFTFSLMTALLSCVVSSVYRTLNIPLERNARGTIGNFAIFGDDIACLSHAAERVYRLLDIIGFSVNVKKSFIEGPFRESCGQDYFLGTNIRGVYLKDISTDESRYVAINRLNDWTARTGIPLPNTVSYLLSKTLIREVPLYEDEDSGVKMPHTLVRKKRYRQGSPLYSKRTSAKQFLSVSEKGVRSRGKWLFFNPPGLENCLLHGSVRNYKIGVRLPCLSYRTKRCVASYWDAHGYGYGFTRYRVSFISACLANMWMSVS